MGISFKKKKKEKNEEKVHVVAVADPVGKSRGPSVVRVIAEPEDFEKVKKDLLRRFYRGDKLPFSEISQLISKFGFCCFPDVPDIVGRSQEYAVPHVGEATPPPPPPLTPGRTRPSLHNFFPKPPPVPPPPEKYYAATEVCKTDSKDGLSKDGRTDPGGYQTLSLSRMLSDNNTDSEFPVTETEDEGCDEDIPVPHIAQERLRVIEELGYGQFGEVKLCEIAGKCELVAVKTLRAGASESTRTDFRHEVKVLAKINDPNIVRVVGACLDEEPIFVVVEYMEFGDLNQFLQEHIAETTTPLPTNAKTLRFVLAVYSNV